MECCPVVVIVGTGTVMGEPHLDTSTGVLAGIAGSSENSGKFVVNCRGPGLPSNRIALLNGLCV